MPASQWQAVSKGCVREAALPEAGAMERAKGQGWAAVDSRRSLSHASTPAPKSKTLRAGAAPCLQEPCCSTQPRREWRAQTSSCFRPPHRRRNPLSSFLLARISDQYQLEAFQVTRREREAGGRQWELGYAVGREDRGAPSRCLAPNGTKQLQQEWSWANGL